MQTPCNNTAPPADLPTTKLQRSVLQMKRKILSVLAVLVAVLMSTVVLTACEKAPAGLENGGGSGESMSTGQGGEPSASESAAESGEDGELYEFVASEKPPRRFKALRRCLAGTILSAFPACRAHSFWNRQSMPTLRLRAMK